MKFGLIAQKLSFASDYRQAGVSRYIEYLIRHLPDVLDPGETLHVFGGPEARDDAFVSEVDGRVDWDWTRWPTGRAPVRILWEQAIAPVTARRRGIDVIHGPVNVVPIFGFSPSIVTVHDLAFLRFPDQYPGLQRRYLYRLTKWSVERAERVIAVSEHTRRDVIELLHADPDSVVAVPNGVSEDFSPRAGSAELTEFRARNSLPDDFVLFVGTLQPRKNLEGLLRAYSPIPPADRLPLVVVGSPGWMYRPIFHELQRLQLTDIVKFAGYADPASLPLWYSAASVFVYPSLYEGFGLPVLESMASGTPAITSTVSSLPEVAGDAAITVEPTDYGALAEEIIGLLDSASRREQLRLRGLERAREFSWRRTAERTAEVYRQVAQERRS